MANNEQRKAPVSQRLKGVIRLERPWFIVFGVALLLASSLAAVAMYQLSSEPAAIQADADTGAVRQDVATTPGGNATQEYREKMEEHNKKQAQKASEEGSTHLPPALAGDGTSNGKQQSLQSMQRGKQNDSSDTTVEREQRSPKGVGGQSQPTPRIKALQEQIRQMQSQMRRMNSQMRQKQQAPSSERDRQTQQVRQEKMSRYRDQLSSLTSELQTETVAQKVKTFESASPQQTAAGAQGSQAVASQSPGDSTGQSSSGQSKGDNGDNEGESKLAINAGDVLYARNEMQLNSDVGGPAQATILSGEYKGAKLLGGFEKKRNYLRVEFGRLVTPEGKQYSIQAYAINPEVSSTAVRSDVDRHMLQRWGGLMAASFLAGFGEAVSQGGSSVSVSDGTTTKSYPDMDMTNQLWSAGGKVGEKLASKFEENFNRPSTVILRSGQKLGILVLSTEN